MGRCPRCGKRWYAGYPPHETPEEQERRLDREERRGIFWSGGCMDAGTCRDCGVELVYDEDDEPR